MAIERLDEMLQQAFDESTKLYQERGFQRRIGFGRRPALVSVDLANAWTRPGNPFTCDQTAMDNEIIPGMQRLLEACRANGHPVVHVTTAYEITDRNSPFTDMGLWHCKIPVDVVDLKNKELWAIDSRIAPVEGEVTLLKKRASSFHGTGLAGLLRAAAGTIALINSIGLIGGFVSPSILGWVKATTGSLANGLYVMAALLLLGAVISLRLQRGAPARRSSRPAAATGSSR